MLLVLQHQQDNYQAVIIITQAVAVVHLVLSMAQAVLVVVQQVHQVGDQLEQPIPVVAVAVVAELAVRDF
jgi:hypothetical protein